MDGIEKITGRIAQDAGREIDGILAEARRQADEITARYEAQAQRESEEIVARGRRNADERVERLASVAQLDARKLELAAKQEMLAKAYDLALEKLLNLPDKEYVDLLAGLAVKASSTGREAVIFSQKDRARYGKAVVTQANEKLGDGHLTMSEQTRPIKGGLILSDGDVEVNCTFETLVRLQRGEMDREVAKVLFD
ncbi:V-type ATP synthase subunit E [Flavonifractor sp. HCP28S3_F3]|uniref:V-type ATP synthase subunit E n=1 Tax=Flavonifractor sp. HCP28S3_F3 TaxID=3438939 RepID=UPI003F8A658B